MRTRFHVLAALAISAGGFSFAMAGMEPPSAASDSDDARNVSDARPAAPSAAGEVRSDARHTSRSMTTSADDVAQVQRTAPIELAQAVRTAEEGCKGRAVRVTLVCDDQARRLISDEAAASHEDHPVYDVIVLGDGRFSRVVVCAKTGKILNKVDLGDKLRGTLMSVSYDGKSHRRDWTSREIDAPTRYQKVSDAVGKQVHSRSNQVLGKIDDLAVDPASGRVLFAIVSTTGVPEMDDKCYAVPWSTLTLDGDGKDFSLPMEKERLRAANGFKRDSWPNLSDDRWVNDTLAYFDAEPYWTKVGDSRGETPSLDKLSRTQRQNIHWFERGNSWIRASEMVRKSVKSQASAESLGKLDELVIDPDAGRLMYGIVIYRNQMFALPWSLWELNPAREHWIVSVTPAQLDAAKVGFNRDSWPNLADERVFRDNCSAFGEQVYWQREE